MRKKVIPILLLVFLVLIFTGRIYGFNVISFVYDTNMQNDWGTAVLNMGLYNFWHDYQKFLDYLPGGILLFTGIRAVTDLFNTSPEAFTWALKIFNTLVDIGFSLGVFYFFKNYFKFSKLKSIFIALCFFGSPALIYISNYWAQIDSVVVLLVCISICFFFNKTQRINNFILSGGFLSLALSLKLQAAMFLPVYGLFLFILKDKKSFINFVIGACIVFAIINLPFLLMSPPRTKFVFLQPFYRSDDITNGAPTFWTLFPSLTTSGSSVVSIGPVNISVATAGTIIFVAILLVVFIYAFKKLYQNKDRLISAWGLKIFIDLMIITNIAYYMFMTKMHSRYAHFAVLLSILSVAMMKSSKARMVQIIFTAIFIATYTLNQITVHYSRYPEFFPQFVSDLAHSSFVNGIMVFAGLGFLAVSIANFIMALHNKVASKTE